MLEQSKSTNKRYRGKR